MKLGTFWTVLNADGDLLEACNSADPSYPVSFDTYEHAEAWAIAAGAAGVGLLRVALVDLRQAGPRCRHGVLEAADGPSCDRCEAAPFADEIDAAEKRGDAAWLAKKLRAEMA